MSRPFLEEFLRWVVDRGDLFTQTWKITLYFSFDACKAQSLFTALAGCQATVNQFKCGACWISFEYTDWCNFYMASIITEKQQRQDSPVGKIEKFDLCGSVDYLF